MKLELLNPTEIMIYKEGFEAGIQSATKEPEMNEERDKLLRDVDLMRDIEANAYLRGCRDASASPVKEFHEAFGHPVKTAPEVPDLKTRILRVKLLLEEVLEFANASGVCVYAYDIDDKVLLTCSELEFWESDEKPDIIEAADALADIRYVTDGANLVWGFPQNELLKEVHSSNMSKLGEDSKPIYREDGKVIKGVNYTPPDIKKVLIEAGWKGEEK